MYIPRSFSKRNPKFTLVSILQDKHNLFLLAYASAMLTYAQQDRIAQYNPCFPDTFSPYPKTTSLDVCYYI